MLRSRWSPSYRLRGLKAMPRAEASAWAAQNCCAGTTRFARISVSPEVGGDGRLRVWRAPCIRSVSERAAESGCPRRRMVCDRIARSIFGAGWPAASVSLSFVALIAGLVSHDSESARLHRSQRLLVRRLRLFLAGILEFIILNGADAFPVLAIGLAPLRSAQHSSLTSKNLLWSVHSAASIYPSSRWSAGAKQSADLQSAGLPLHRSTRHRGSGRSCLRHRR